MPSLRDILKKLGEIRDGILPAISGAYALGFVVWTVHAWRQRLGLLPIFNTRYFIAGFPVVFTLLITYCLLNAGRWLKAWALEDPPSRRRICRRFRRSS